ncbi:MAG: glycosyltransferase [Flavonifractor plautii]
MKIVVYAICKNEAGHAERWMASMAEADGVYVLDTGSTDGTAERLRALGAVVVEERVEPWRFDTARNRSLELVPEDADICVCTDLDEVFHPGWRAALEAAWTDGTTQAVYRYTWNFNADGSEGTVFWIEKIHARRGYRWTHPVHEVLERQEGWGPGRKCTAEGCSWTTTPTPPNPGAVPAPAGAVGGGGPGGRPQHPLPGPGVPVLRPVGRLYPHTGAPPVPAHRRLGG